jgi:ketosteroid isomerase-like protein
MYGAGSSGWRYVVEPEAVHAAVETAFNAGDVDALMGLYEPDARMVRDDASVAVGLDEIRAVWADPVALGGRVHVVTRYAVESGGIALLSNDWTLELEGTAAASGTTAEVARRQDDGTWRYVIDNPFGADTHAP